MTDGTPAAAPKTPKSSEPITGSVATTLAAPSERRSAAASRSVNPGSFTTACADSLGLTKMVGSLVAPEAAASAFAIRAMAATSCLRTSGL